jgi:hypothetical protein
LTRKDWAEQIKKLTDEDFPLAEKIILVMDNLNTHSVASLYETFPTEEAKRLRDKLEIHYTPKHGNWLNMAETNWEPSPQTPDPSVRVFKHEVCTECKTSCRRATALLLYLSIVRLFQN